MIKEIKLTNFRGFEEHTIPLNTLTIAVGKNNAGKSTLVEALRLVSIITSRFQNLNYYELPSWLDRPRRERGVFPATGEFEFSTEAVFHRLGDPPAQISARFSTGELVEVFIGPELDVLGIVRDRNGEPVRSRGQANQINLPRVSILPQIGPLLREEMLLGEAYVRQSLSSSRSSLHFRNQLHYLRQHFKAFQELAETTWRGVSVQPIETKQINSGDRVVSLFVRDGDFISEVGWMGHGLQMWLQTMWFLTHASQSSTVILDEPDVYMHADLQRRLIRFLRGRQHQTIVATHSVEIMSEVEADEILVIDRRKSRSTFAGNQPEVQGLLASIGSIHNIQLARLNAAGRFIVVEGDDMDFLKRFQNTLFPNSSTPIDTIPYKDVGGWSGWERARGFALLLRDETSGSIRTYCIFDRDYHRTEDVEKRLNAAKTERLQLHVWAKKEIENYLLVPTAIQRLIEKGRPRKRSTPSLADIEMKLSEIADTLKADVISGVAAEIFNDDRRLGFPGATKKAFKIVERVWNTLAGRLAVVCGKDVISGISGWSNAEFNVSLNSVKLAKELTVSEIDVEIKKVLTAIEGAASL